MADTVRSLNIHRKLALKSPLQGWNDYTNKYFISSEMFEEILVVYENNQLYYRENMMIEELVGLEYWFMHVVEPPPKVVTDQSMTDWEEREATKLLGYSYYCLPCIRNIVNTQSRDFNTILLNSEVVKNWRNRS